MRTLHCMAAIVFSCVTLFGSMVCAHESAALSSTRQAAKELDTWLGSGANGQSWRTYLGAEALQAELAKDAQPDPAVLAKTIQKLTSRAPGLEGAKYVALRTALENLLAQRPVDEVVLAAKGTFQTPAEPQIQQAKAVLQTAVDKLDRFLTASGANGQGWKTYLGWNELQEAIKAGPEANLATLRAIDKRFKENKVGLELPVFANVEAALAKYLRALNASRDATAAATLDSSLEELAKDLQAYASTPNEATAGEIATALAWLDQYGQAPAVAASVKRRWSAPNAFVEVSDKILGAGIRQDVNDVIPVRDNILGTAVSGTAHTVGRLDTVLVPDAKRGVFDAVLSGTTYSKTVGQNGPATIYSTGTTKISGRKRVVVDSSGLKSYPATAAAVTKTRIDGVAAGNGGLVQRIAQKKVAEGKGQAERVASQRAEAKIRARVEKEAGTGLSRANNDFQQKFRNPLVRRHAFPEVLNFSTESNALLVTALQAGAGQLGAPGAPPKLENPHPMVAKVHESLINNAAASLWAGRTVTNEEVKQDESERGEWVPEEFKALPPQDSVGTVTFIDGRPVSLTLKGGGFNVVVRVKEFSSGDKVYRTAMDVTADYVIKQHEGGARLERQGDLKVEPAKGGKQSPQLLTLKTVLKKKFSRVLLETMTFKALVLPGKWSKAGTLNITELKSDGGWVTIGWDQAAAAAAPVAGEPSTADGWQVVDAR